jgi:hypothetical protein
MSVYLRGTLSVPAAVFRRYLPDNIAAPPRPASVEPQLPHSMNLLLEFVR